MKKTITTLAAGLLMSAAGLASAAEPVQLSDSDMDKVAAGAMQSVATTSGFALFGTVASGAETGAYVRYSWGSVTKKTYASSATISSGILVTATASAGSSF